MTHRRTRMLAAVALMGILAACGGAVAPSTAVPTPTPTATIALTPTPTPTPTPAPTPTAAPTMTADDLKIDFIVKDGVARMLAFANEGSGLTSGSETITILYKMKSLAESQVTLPTVTAPYTASPCTQEAWDLYQQGMGQMSSGVDTVLAWVAAGAVGTVPGDDVTASVRTLTSAVAALKAGCTSPVPSAVPTAAGGSPSPTGYAAVQAALDTPGTLMTALGTPARIVPDEFVKMWNNSVGLQAFRFGKIGSLPASKPDAAGRPVVRVTLGGSWEADVVMVLNDDGSLRSAALVTPTGGYGGASPYWQLTSGQNAFIGALRPFVDPAPILNALGLTDEATPRAGLDTSTDAGGLHFHFIGTADHGDWLIATAAP